MNAAVEADRELLLATLRRHADALPTGVVCSLSEATDELVDPLALPVPRHVDERETRDLLQVVVGVRRRLMQCGDSTAATGEAMACARAARALGAAEQELATQAQR